MEWEPEAHDGQKQEKAFNGGPDTSQNRPDYFFSSGDCKDEQRTVMGELGGGGRGKDKRLRGDRTLVGEEGQQKK